MKIIESEEENNENRKVVEIDNYDGPDDSQGSGNITHTKIMFGKDTPSEDPLDDSNLAVEIAKDKDSVPTLTPRGRGRPRKYPLVTDADAVSPLAKVSATPSRGRGRPRKEGSRTKSPLMKDSPFPSERRGRGRPKKIVSESDVTKPVSAEKPDEKESAHETDLKQKEGDSADSVPRRGRGRPRKNFGSFSASSSLTEGKAGSTPRRGRGRPRKNFKNVGGTLLAKGRIGHQNDFRRMGAIELLAQALAKQGRGRPRKGTGIKDAVQLLQKDPAIPKPGRGRPPKSIKRMFAMKLLAKAMGIGCQDEAAKNISIADVTKTLKDASGASRRGRGRPRKILTVAATVSENAHAVTPRGRGRPRKNPETSDTTLLTSKAPALTPGTPRGRGRPRKNLVTVDAPVLPSKVTEPVTASTESTESTENMSDVQHDKDTSNPSTDL